MPGKKKLTGKNKRSQDINHNPSSRRSISVNKHKATIYEEAERLYSAVIETTDTGYLMLDEAGKIIQANLHYARLAGFEKIEDVLGRSVIEWTCDYDRERNAKEIAKCFKYGFVRNVEMDYFHTDGVIVPVEINATVIETKRGKRIISLCRDISDRKKTEAALRESEVMLRMAQRIASFGHYVFDARSGDWTGSEELDLIFGIGHEYDRTIDGWLALVHPEDREEMREYLLENVLEEKNRFNKEYRIARVIDGGIRWIHGIGNLEFDGSGTPVKMFGTIQDITERKLAEEALRRSEDRFRRIFEEGQFGITIAGPDYRFIDANPAFCRMTGYTVQELSSLTFADITHPDTLGRDRENVIALTKEEISVYKTEKKYLKKNGDILWGSLMTSALRDWEGNVICYLAMIVDITERKLAEETLRTSEEKYRSIIEQNSEGVVLLNRSGEIIEWNRAIEEITGIKRETAIGKTFLDMQLIMMPPERTPPERIAFLKEQISDVLVNEKSALFRKPIEANFVRGDRTVYILQTIFPIRTGNDYKIAAIIRDITERKLAERAIASEKEQLAITLRSIGDGVITTDVSGNVIIMNKVAERLTGWTQEEAAGKQLESVFRLEDEPGRGGIESPVKQVLAAGRIVEMGSPAVLVSRDRAERVITASSAPISDESGNIMGVVLVFRDITEMQKLLEAAQRTQRLESLGILAGGIAHDFNNLLGGIYGNIEMVRSLANDAKLAPYLDATMNTLSRARNLTQQLLTFAKGGAPVRKVGKLFPLVRETAEFVLSGSNASCTFEIDDGLWLCDYDSNQIGQVIENLLINALQALPAGGGMIFISASNVKIGQGKKTALPEGNYIKLAIKDNGAGIPKEIQSKIFDPFFTTKQKGSGLGLATSYSIVQRHGGIIELDSTPGAGSTFYVFLPASEKKTADFMADSSAIHKGAGRILLMDDEEVLRRTIKTMLETIGYSCLTAKDGSEAVSILKHESLAGRKLAAIILDLTIHGGMGGKETIALLREIDDSVPVIVSSGYADDPIMASPYEYGFAGSLNKPFTLVELSQLLRFVIGG